MFMLMADIVSRRSTCLRKQVGAVIAKDHRVVSMGYNGAPSRMPHCLEVGCLSFVGDEKDPGCQRAVHAEANAIAFAARQGIAVEGATLYVTLAPCLNCAKLIINAGIKRVVYGEPYRENKGIELLDMAGIEVVLYEYTPDVL